ncbi:MAG TPA: hypothetical protein VGG10_21740 [Rhizomicrobium sp.]
MRPSLPTIAVLAALALAPTAGADTLSSCAADWGKLSPSKQGLTTYRAYTRACYEARGPQDTPPAGATSPLATPRDRAEGCVAKWDSLVDKKTNTVGGQTRDHFLNICTSAT